MVGLIFSKYIYPVILFLVTSIGPIAKSFPPHVTEIHSATLDALEAVGLPRNPDNVRLLL